MHQNHPIFSCLTSAIQEQDVRMLGTCLLRYSTFEGKAAELKNDFLSWLSLELMTCEREEAKHIFKELSVTTGSAAMIHYLNFSLDRTAAPTGFLQKLKNIGNTLLKKAGSRLETGEQCNQEVYSAFRTIEAQTGLIGKVFKAPVVCKVFVLPAKAIKSCATVYISSNTPEKPVYHIIFFQNEIFNMGEVVLASLAAIISDEAITGASDVKKKEYIYTTALEIRSTLRQDLHGAKVPKVELLQEAEKGNTFGRQTHIEKMIPSMYGLLFKDLISRPMPMGTSETAIQE